MNSAPTSHRLIWDLPTRLFHWLLALLVALQYATGLLGEDWLIVHGYLGYLTLTLIVFRVLWGVFGGHWSRFSTFIPSLHQLIDYVKTPINPHSDKSPGHNPLGAVSVLSMLVVLALQVVSGSMSNDDIAFAGPYAAHVSNAVVEWMTWYHSCVGYYLIIAITTLHIFAIAFYRFFKHQHLTSAMIHGHKKLEASVEASNDSSTRRLLALGLFVISALSVYLLVVLA